jgi:hypothetical protein
MRRADTGYAKTVTAQVSHSARAVAQGPVDDGGNEALLGGPWPPDSEDRDMTEKADIRVGDLVQFHYGTAKVAGIVKEDRGPIGLKGRRRIDRLFD